MSDERWHEGKGGGGGRAIRECTCFLGSFFAAKFVSFTLSRCAVCSCPVVALPFFGLLCRCMCCREQPGPEGGKAEVYQDAHAATTACIDMPGPQLPVEELHENEGSEKRLERRCFVGRGQC